MAFFATAPRSTRTAAGLLVFLVLPALPLGVAAQEASVAAGTQLLQEQRWEEAAGVFRVVTEREPDNAMAWYRLGMALQDGGDQTAAIAPLERAAELGFQTPFARLRVARAHASMGHAEVALSTLERAASEGLNVPGMLEHEDLAGLASDPRYQKVLQAVRVASAPCQYDDAYRAFDFWIGEWDVFNPAGQQVGENRIVQLIGTCGLQENWTDAGGNRGQSVNLYDSNTGNWRQLWYTDKGQITDYSTGTLVGEAIEFRAVGAGPNGATRHTRMVFTPVAPDTVTQEIFQSPDGETWSSAWLGVYVRKAESGGGGGR